MPEGPLGFPRLTDIGPMTETTMTEEIESILDKYSKEVTVTETDAGTAFEFKLNIEAQTVNVPVAQPIPSNLMLSDDNVRGTLRPPMVDSRQVKTTPEKVERTIEDMVEPNINVLAVPGAGGTIRPHVKLEDATVEAALNTVKQLHNNYNDTFNDTN